MTLALRVTRLGKQYMLGELRGYKMIRDSLTDVFSSLCRRPNGREGTGTFSGKIWALHDVSFEIEAGEVVGIIGRNGAGKTTLLKILSRITEPSTGTVELFGRVSSLLEVGTGFHPELTGRENIFLNASILGMRKREIAAKFDEIVDFAGVERFLNTPVKRYSSGMQVRLAFSVAAHLEPEILLVDEVLAVGDAEFQRKCVGKMSDIARRGRTVIFVSHNMAAVEKLCDRGILLEEGELKENDQISNVIETYVSSQRGISKFIDSTNHPNRENGLKKIIHRFRILNKYTEDTNHIGLGEEVTFEVYLSSTERIASIVVSIHIYNWVGQKVTTLHTRYQSNLMIDINGKKCLSCTIPSINFASGVYYVSVELASADDITEVLDRIEAIASFEVLPKDIFGTGKIPPQSDGVIVCPCVWRII